MNDIDQTALEIARAFIPVDVVGQQRANLQVAIIEAIKKHANPKTLADVQPGGRVRLGDQALRVFSAGRWTYDGTGQSFSHEEMDAAAFVVYRDAAQAVNLGPGIEAAAKLIQKKADDYAEEFGYDDMGGLSFGRGLHAEVKSDHHSFMLELVDELRALIDSQAVGNG